MSARLTVEPATTEDPGGQMQSMTVRGAPVCDAEPTVERIPRAQLNIGLDTDRRPPQ